MRFLLLLASLALGASALAAQLQYRVQRGDTAYSVARHYGMTVDQLVALNHLQSAVLYAGQLLTVTVADAPSTPSPLSTSTAGNALSGSVPDFSGAPVGPSSSAPVSLSTAAGNPFQLVAPGAAHIRLGQVGAAPTSPDLAVPQAAGQVSSAPVMPVRQTAPSQSLSVARGVYQVARGDTAFSIAKRSGLSVDALLAMNNLGSSDLRVGQWLSLDGAPHPGAPTIQAGGITLVPVTAPLSLPAPSTAPSGPTPPASQQSPLGDASPQAGAVQSSSVPPNLVQLGDPAGLALLSSAPAGSLRARAAAWLGVPYVYGGSSVSGTDCSGLVVQLFGALGLNLPRRSIDEFKVGTPVDIGALTEGDLVFFATSGNGEVSHVGVYLAGGYFLDANSYLGRVAVDKLSDRYYASRYLGARRVLPASLAQSAPTQSASSWTATSSPLGSR